MRQVGINTRDEEKRALDKYDHLRAQGLSHADAVTHSAIYFGVLNARFEQLLKERRHG